MYINEATILLQASPMGGGLGPIFLILMFVVMYFFMILPQNKKAKAQKKFADEMTVGEQIVTTAGIHGRIDRANEDGTLKLEISRTTFMTIERSAVSMEMTQAARKRGETATVTSVAPAKS